MRRDVTLINPDGQRTTLAAGFDAFPITPPPIDLNHPRLLLTATMADGLRIRIRTEAAFKTRWQTAITQFESSKSTWTLTPTDPFACAFAAFLSMIRRPTDDLGLTWKGSWQDYRTKITNAAKGWSRDGRHEVVAIATAVIYDCLYQDLTDAERFVCEGWAELAYSRNEYLGTGVEVYDNGASDDHAAKVLSALVSARVATRLLEVYARMMDVVDTNDWMGYGFGLGREWHEGYTSRHGLPFLLYALKHAGGYTDAQTVDHFLTHLRDSWQLTHDAIIPHPSTGMTNGTPWTSDKFHTQDPIKGFHRQMNVAAHMLWALAILPGKLQRTPAPDTTDQATLAASDAAYFGWLRTVFDESTALSPARLRDVVDCTLMGKSTSTHVARFWAFPAWLIHGAQEYPPMTAAAAGIPQVRRYWPGTLEWTFINSPDFSKNAGSVIRYTHRRYGSSQYEEGTRQNGRWHVHRDGPLLIQRGETGHGISTRRLTHCANGTVSFVDTTIPALTFSPSDDSDNAGIRAVRGSGNTKAQILSLGLDMDFGPVTAWHADASIVAITSDLTSSYNSSQVQTGPPALNERKIAKFIREFVVIRRGGDGTPNEKVFTYDRITLLDTKFEPRYNLCPAANPTIDGTETVVNPWGPDQSNPAFDWYAVGPTHWDYPGATRMIYDNRAEPKAPIPGNGKVCVTWLQPSAVKVRKAGGTNARHKTNAQMAGYPFFSPWRGWSGKEEWAAFVSLEKRAYVGLYTVTVAPATVSLDTRFLMACEVMAADAQPSSAVTVPCDPLSVAARCGASIVVFGKDGLRDHGYVDVPTGVRLVTVVNRSQGATTIPVSAAGRVSF